MLFKDSTNIIPSINVKTVNKKRKRKKIGIQSTKSHPSTNSNHALIWKSGAILTASLLSEVQVLDEVNDNTCISIFQRLNVLRSALIKENCQLSQVLIWH